MFTNDGKFLKQLVTPRNRALSPDSDQQFLYVGNGKEISIVDRKTLEIVGSVQGSGMLGGGRQIATDAKDNIDVAASGNGMQKLTFEGMSPLVSR
jgi:hypothetical protein